MPARIAPPNPDPVQPGVVKLPEPETEPAAPEAPEPVESVEPEAPEAQQPESLRPFIVSTTRTLGAPGFSFVLNGETVTVGETPVPMTAKEAEALSMALVAQGHSPQSVLVISA